MSIAPTQGPNGLLDMMTCDIWATPSVAVEKNKLYKVTVLDGTPAIAAISDANTTGVTAVALETVPSGTRARFRLRGIVTLASTSVGEGALLSPAATGTVAASAAGDLIVARAIHSGGNSTTPLCYFDGLSLSLI